VETGGTVFNKHVGDKFPGGQEAEQFVVGLLTFTNGTTNGTSEVNGVDLQISLVAFIAGTTTPDPSTPSHSGVRTLHLDIINTPNDPDPLNPDIIQISLGLCNSITEGVNCTPGQKNGVQFDEFHVIEGQTATVQILGFFSSFDIVGFGQVDDPTKGFVSSSAAIPEPSSLVLVGGGLIALVLARQRKSLRGPDIDRRQQ